MFSAVFKKLSCKIRILTPFGKIDLNPAQDKRDFERETCDPNLHEERGNRGAMDISGLVGMMMLISLYLISIYSCFMLCLAHTMAARRLQQPTVRTKRINSS